MIAFINLNSNKHGEVNRFLSKFYNNDLKLKENNWEKKFSNPLEIAEFIGVFIDNSEHFNLTMWISIDSGIVVKIDNKNANDIIKYLFERYPY